MGNTTLPFHESEYSSADKAAMARSLQLDSREAINLFREVLLEKWSGKGPNGGSDWLGEQSVDRGFPALRDDKAKLNMAVLLENQTRFQRQFDMKVVGNRVIQADTTTADESLPTKYALPTVRRAYVPVLNSEWSAVQPMTGPSAYVFFLDFIRESDNTNLLSVEYNWMLTAELGVPNKGKTTLKRTLIQALKQLLAVSWSSEAEEDLRAQLGLDLENEMMVQFTKEFTRTLFGRHILAIYNAATSGSAQALPTAGDPFPLPLPQAGPNNTHVIPAASGQSAADRKASIYNVMVDADTDFRRNNMIHSDGILCGLGLAGLFQKLITLTGAEKPQDSPNSSTVGYSSFGTYEGRWTIYGTEYLPDNAGFMFRRNPDQLEAGHIYAPYVPITATPRIYADMTTSTGAYTNKDAWTRNIRERSADIVTKPYAFQPISAANVAF